LRLFVPCSTPVDDLPGALPPTRPAGRAGVSAYPAVEIVTKAGTAYLVPADEYNSLRETAYLLRSPANAARLRRSLAEAQSTSPDQSDDRRSRS
jgi:hypothetical protein